MRRDALLRIHCLIMELSGPNRNDVDLYGGDICVPSSCVGYQTALKGDPEEMGHTDVDQRDGSVAARETGRLQRE